MSDIYSSRKSKCDKRAKRRYSPYKKGGKYRTIKLNKDEKKEGK